MANNPWPLCSWNEIFMIPSVPRSRSWFTISVKHFIASDARIGFTILVNLVSWKFCTFDSENFMWQGTRNHCKKKNVMVHTRSKYLFRVENILIGILRKYPESENLCNIARNPSSPIICSNSLYGAFATSFACAAANNCQFLFSKWFRVIVTRGGVCLVRLTRKLISG